MPTAPNHHPGGYPLFTGFLFIQKLRQFCPGALSSTVSTSTTLIKSVMVPLIDWTGIPQSGRLWCVCFLTGQKCITNPYCTHSSSSCSENTLKITQSNRFGGDACARRPLLRVDSERFTERYFLIQHLADQWVSQLTPSHNWSRIPVNKFNISPLKNKPSSQRSLWTELIIIQSQVFCSDADCKPLQEGQIGSRCRSCRLTESVSLNKAEP